MATEMMIDTEMTTEIAIGMTTGITTEMMPGIATGMTTTTVTETTMIGEAADPTTPETGGIGRFPSPNQK